MLIDHLKKKGSPQAFRKVSGDNETHQHAGSFEETLPYKVNIIEVGLIVKVPAVVCIRYFLKHLSSYSQKPNCHQG